MTDKKIEWTLSKPESCPDCDQKDTATTDDPARSITEDEAFANRMYVLLGRFPCVLRVDKDGDA